MIRPLTPFDVARCVLLSDQEKFNRVYTLNNLPKRRPSLSSVLQASLSGLIVRGKPAAWVWHKGNSIIGIITTGQRCGNQSWEIRHLSVNSAHESQISDLLDKAARSAASSGARKVFIRLLREDPLVDIARQSGYFPKMPEVLYVKELGPERHELPASEGEPPISLIPKSDADDHDLFRLYNASTPCEVRYDIGMTIDQWMASREPISGHALEWVHRSGDGSLVGWLKVVRKGANGHLAATTHPDHEKISSALVRYGLSHLEGVQDIYTIVPEYQIIHQRALSETGFKPVSDHVTLIKTMTVNVTENSRNRVAAPGI